MIPNTLVIQIVRTGVKKIVVDGEQEVQRIKYNRPVDFFRNDLKLSLFNNVYKLVSVIYHSGNFDDKGHYTTDSYRPTKIHNNVQSQEFRWHTFDDGVVTVKAENYMISIRQKSIMKNPRMKNVVLLMYEKE